MATLQMQYQGSNAPHLLAAQAEVFAEILTLADRITTPEARALYSSVMVNQGALRGDRSLFRAGLDGYAELADGHAAHRSAGSPSRNARATRRATATSRPREGHANELLARVNETGELDALLWYVSSMGAVKRLRGDLGGMLELNEPLIVDELPVTVHAGPVVMMALCESERHDEARALAPRFFPRTRALPAQRRVPVLARSECGRGGGAG